jgi:DNA-binding response OmpR family regulator
VLVVDDDIISRNALQSLLKAAGHQVSTAGTIAEALVGLDPAIDTVVLDLMLPDGDGTEVLRRIRAAGSKTRVCVTTGVSSQTWLRQVSDLKPECILRKPIDLAELLDKL